MSLVRSPGRVAGMMDDLPGFPVDYFRGNKASNILITYGDLVHLNTGTSPPSYRTTPASATVEGEFAIAQETVTVAQAKTKISLARNGVGYLIADGAIPVGSDVIASASTAGQVIAITHANLTATPSKLTCKVGVCYGKANDWRTGAPLDAVDGDLVAVALSPAGGV